MHLLHFMSNFAFSQTLQTCIIFRSFLSIVFWFASVATCVHVFDCIDTFFMRSIVDIECARKYQRKHYKKRAVERLFKYFTIKAQVNKCLINCLTS